jgi:hypothetical protein
VLSYVPRQLMANGYRGMIGEHVLLHVEVDYKPEPGNVTDHSMVEQNAKVQ